MSQRFRELEQRHGIEGPKVEEVPDTVFRVYTERGPIDYRPSKVEVGLDGSLQLSQVWTLPPKVDIPTGRTLVGMEMRLLAIIGPTGIIRGESVDVPATAPAADPSHGETGEELDSQP